MIYFSNVSKRYASGHQALNQVSFHLKKAEMAFLTGHSGAGKSTLLKLITAIETPNQGQVLVDNHNISQLKSREVPYLRRQIGIIFQNPHLLSKRTVFDNVALPLVIHGVPHDEVKRKVRAALDKVGLASKEKMYPATLSAGEQQRVSIARAVVNKPPLLLADEPTGNLDPRLAMEIIQLLEEFNRVGVSVLVATHDLTMIASMPYRILTLKQGRLIQGA
jgi:cell division transport system ATP-binding protein